MLSYYHRSGHYIIGSDFDEIPLACNNTNRNTNGTILKNHAKLHNYRTFTAVPNRNVPFLYNCSTIEELSPKPPTYSSFAQNSKQHKMPELISRPTQNKPPITDQSRH